MQNVCPTQTGVNPLPSPPPLFSSTAQAAYYMKRLRNLALKVNQVKRLTKGQCLRLPDLKSIKGRG